MQRSLNVGFILTVLSRSAFGHATVSDMTRLHNDLTSNYCRHIRPVINQSEPVMINITFSLVYVSAVKDIESEIDVISLIIVRWHDYNFVWDPEDYGGINTMRLTEETIWAPKIYLYLSQSNQGFVFDPETSHTIWSDGLVSFSGARTRSTHCTMDMTYFPYDYQKCNFQFHLSDAARLEVDISQAQAKFDAEWVENKEWMVKSLTSSVKYYGSPEFDVVLLVTIVIRRRPTFNNLNIIAPAIIISILCMLTFMVPLETGERLSYTLTTVLSLSVYITYIGTLIPNSSHPVPILFQYVVSLFIICGITVMLTLLIIKIRWSPVKRTADNRKYVSLLGFKLFFTKLPWLNKICVLPYKRNDNHKITVSPEHYPSRNARCEGSDVTHICKLTHHDIHEREEQENVNTLQPELERKQKLHPATDHVCETAKTSARNEVEEEADHDLLKLCLFLDVSCFILTVVAFVVVTVYILVRFNSSEEPT